MDDRNFSQYEFFKNIARNHTPKLAFRGRTKEDFQEWHAAAREKFLEILGDFPEPVDLNPMVEFCKEWKGLIRERVILDSEAGMSIPCVVLRPPDMPADGKGRAIICSHGHGAHAKEAVSGNTDDPDIVREIAAHNYNYGEQMARRGFLTLSPDLRGFGERMGLPNNEVNLWCKSCNNFYLLGSMLGIYPLTRNVWDIRVCARYLATRPEVDAQRIGMMGLSQGGVMTTFATAALPEIRCADIVGYLNPWRRFAFEGHRFCGSQILPHIYKWFDTHDVASLIAPRPLLVEMGEADMLFYIKDQRESFEAVKRVYDAAGVGEDCWCDVHPGAHAFAGNKAFDFFERYL